MNGLAFYTNGYFIRTNEDGHHSGLLLPTLESMRGRQSGLKKNFIQIIAPLHCEGVGVGVDVGVLISFVRKRRGLQGCSLAF